jgi:flagellar hook protein FlgE
MGLTTTIYSGVSGMTASGNGLNLISDNIANVNTVGFKGSKASFSDFMESRLVDLSSVQTSFKQGDITQTTSPLDFAIEGRGLFIVNDPTKNNSYYTRNGEFDLDSQNYITTNLNGMRLQGYVADDSGTISTSLGDIRILPQETLTQAAAGQVLPNSGNGSFTTGNQTAGMPMMPAKATSKADLRFNLQGSPTEPVIGSVSLLDPADLTKGPATSKYNFSSDFTVYDSEGAAHGMSIYFQKTSADQNTWEARACWYTGDTTKTYQEQDLGQMSFDQSGNMTALGPVTINATWDGGGTALQQAITLNMDGSTQYGSPSTTAYENVDGYAEGGLSDFRMDSRGMLYGIYSNGKQKLLAQVALADFSAPDELKKIGNNLFTISTGSGSPQVKTSGMDGAGTVLGRSLEMSNVDMADQFVQMIAMQRAFQASSKIISTSDEMYTTIVGLHI